MLNFFKKHALFIGMVLLVLLAAFPMLLYPMGRDQGMYANIGRVILAGGKPFINMWDIKPPPIYYLYALGIGLFGVTSQAIRALDFIFIPLGMLGLYLLGQRLSSKSLGLWAALLFAVFYFNDGFQNLSQSDSLATVPAIWAGYMTILSLQAEAGSRRALVFACLTGMISGLLLWFKPQYAIVILAWVGFYLYQRINMVGEGLRPSPTKLKNVVYESFAFSLGGLMTGGGLLLYFGLQGILSEMLIVGQGTAAYNAQGYDFAAFIANMSNGFYYRWIIWHGLMLLVGFWFLWQLIRLIRRENAPSLETMEGKSPLAPTGGRGDIGVRGQSLFFFLWFMAGLGFVFIQAKGFDTHWFPALPPMALMGATVLDSLGKRIEKGAKKLLIVFNSLFVIGLLAVPTMTTWGGAWNYLTGQEDLVAYWDRFQANDLKPEESLLMANYLRERTIAGDSLFIWGFRPEVYYLAQLYPATRYQAQFPLVAPWYPQEWKQNNVDRLWAAMPPYALVLEDDFMPWVTDFDADSHTLLQDYTELNNWLIANYERIDQIGDFIIWKRREP